MKKPEKQNHRKFQEDSEKLLRKVRETEQVSPKEIMAGWTKIQQQIPLRPNFIKRNISYIYAAACICLLLAGGGLFYLSQESLFPSDLASEIQQPEIETIYTDIVLITEDQMVHLENDVTLEYDSEGKLQSKGQSQSSLQQEYKVANNTLIVPDGKRAYITLSDGTKMHINSGSRVQYPSRFTGEYRQISVEGEVFLSVVKDEEHPFLVKTEEMEIKVLGTQFNVCAYKEDNSSSVVLVEGSVEVYTNDTEKALLQPSQRLEFSEGSIDIQHVDIYEYTCWIDNVMLLTNKNTGEVMDRLARYYKRTILYDQKIKEIPLSGKLDMRDNLEESVENICLSVGLKYTVNENNEILLTIKK